MNIKNIFLGALVAMASVSASAQTTQTTTVEEFNPHWYVQLQGGAQYTLGELSFDRLLSPNAQVVGGYQFSPVFGARIAVNAWQSKAGSALSTGNYKWKWYYVAPTADLTVNLTNLCFGYKPGRFFNLSVFGGLGANIAWWNRGHVDDAWHAKAEIMQREYTLLDKADYMEYIWMDTKTRFVAQFGLIGDFRINDNFSINLEVNANTLSDHYNSKRAGNTDWYFNGLVGLRYNFGATHKTKTIVTPVAEPKIVEKIVERAAPTAVEKAAPVPVAAKVTKLQREVFFLIRGSDISITERPKCDEIVDFLKKNPNAKVTVTGYADKGTGNPRVNKMYSEKRAAVVTEYLKAQGIAASRITTQAKGDTEQPFPGSDPDTQAKNRVSVMIAE